MKFITEKTNFLEALQKTQSVVERKNTVQILSNVLLNLEKNNLSFSATDLEVGIKIFLNVKEENSGCITLSVKNLVELIKEMPEKKPIIFSLKENHWVEILCQKSIFNLAGSSANEFPKLPEFEGVNYFEVNTVLLKEMLDLTSFVASTDETRYHLNGVLIEQVQNGISRMVGTDGHRLAIMQGELLLNSNPLLKTGIVVPKKGLQELRKLLTNDSEKLLMAIDKGNLLIKVGNANLFIHLIDGNFPDYEQVIPKENEKKFTIDREEFLSALKRVSLLSNEKSRSIKLSLSNKSIIITASHLELGDAKEELEVDYSYEALEIAFNARYLIECLSVLDVKKVSFELGDKLTPSILRPVEKQDYTYVIMPIRI